MAWTISYDTTVVTLPFAPTTIEDRNPASIETGLIYGDLPWITSLGKETRTVTLMGIIYNPSLTESQMESTYITPLKNAVHKQVTLDGAGSRYDGDYIMEEFSYEERAGEVLVFHYTIRLVQGSEYIVM